MIDPPNPPEAAGDKPAGEGRAEPLAGEVSRARVGPGPAAPASGKPGEAVRTLAPPSGPPDPPPPADVPIPAFIDALQRALPGAVAQLSLWVGDWTIIVPASALLDVAQHLRDTPGAQFDCCSDLTATDWPARA
jgi:NADH-quinone oxidoreductase subunit C